MAASGDFRLREQRLEHIRSEALRNTEAQRNTELQVPQASPEHGYYGMPVVKKPAWTWEIPIYFFVGGAAGAASVLASAAKLNDADAKLVRDAQWIAAIGGAISPALLTADLGRPTRFLNMLRVFKVQSPMSVGSWTLVAFSSSAAATLLLGEWERRTGRKIPVVKEAAPVLSMLSGLVLATYTGVLIGATTIPAWHENVSILPIHFGTSGLAAATSMLELRGHTNTALNTLGIAASTVETVTGAALELRRSAGTEPVRSGKPGWMMRAAGLLSGPLPLALRLLAMTGPRDRSRKLRRAAAISSVAGSMVTRWAWVEAGKASARDPRAVLLAKPERELAGKSEKVESQAAVRARAARAG
jgi:hypothetical protein